MVPIAIEYQHGLFVFHKCPRSKLVIRSQRDYFGKKLQVFFPKKNFYMQMNF